MFDRVYHHRVSSGFDYMIEYICNNLLKLSDGGFKYPKSIYEFLPMTDESIESLIAQLARTKRSVPAEVKFAAQLFTTRSPLKKIREEDIIDDDLDERLQELKDLYNKDNQNDEANRKLIFFKKLQRLTKMHRDNSATESGIIMIHPNLPHGKPENINRASDVLKSNAWRDIKIRIFVFESFRVSADCRNVVNKL